MRVVSATVAFALALGLAAGTAASGWSPDAANVTYDVRADQWVGKTVLNVRGSEIGSVEDLVVDTNDRIYAVVSVGGFLGIGAKEVAIPLDRLQASDGDVVLMSQASAEELAEMRPYDSRAYRPYAE